MCKMFTCILVVTLLSLCNALRLQTYNKNCGHAHGGTINYIEVTGCNSEPCVAHPNKQYSITVNFTASTHITSAKNVLHGVFLGLQVKSFPVSPVDNCGNGLTCPMQPGETGAYTVALSFTQSDVPISIKIGSKWELQDANGHDILCFIIPLDVRNS